MWHVLQAEFGEFVPDLGHRGAARDEVLLDVVVVVLVLDSGHVAGRIDAERRRDGLVVARRQRRVERVDRVADVQVVPGAVGVRRGLGHRDSRIRARRIARPLPGRVGGVLPLAGVPPGEHEADRERPRGDDALAVERHSEVVRVVDVHDRVKGCVDRDAVDRDLESRPDVAEFVGREPELLLLRSEQYLRVARLRRASPRHRARHPAIRHGKDEQCAGRHRRDQLAPQRVVHESLPCPIKSQQKP